jgi:hypothetical protein
LSDSWRARCSLPSAPRSRGSIPKTGLPVARHPQVTFSGVIRWLPEIFRGLFPTSCELLEGDGIVVERRESCSVACARRSGCGTTAGERKKPTRIRFAAHRLPRHAARA